MSLPPNEINRYAQQLKLDQIGFAGQLKLKNARVLCIGAGGLGSAVLLYLAAAGIGMLGIVDDDVVELSNLQRQVLYQHQHLGCKKSWVAQQQLLAFNPNVTVNVYGMRLDVTNAREIIAQYDIVVDCSDNFATRYLVHDICFYFHRPYVFASISQFKGQCSFFFGATNPCFRCLFPMVPVENIPPDCAQGGVLSTLPGLLGIIQATEVIKWLLQLSDLLLGRLLVIDILKMQFRSFYLTHNPQCELCVHQKSIASLQKSAVCASDFKHDLSEYAITADELRERLKSSEDILLLDVRTITEHVLYNLGGVLIPITELPDRWVELDPRRTIIVYCQSGKRSAKAIKILMKENFYVVRYLQGGINEWQK